MKSIFYFVIAFVVKVESDKILAVFPVPSPVRRFVFRPLILELANRGHEIVLITPYVSILKEHMHENIIHINTASVLESEKEDKKKDSTNNYVKEEVELSKIFIKQMQSNQVQNALKENDFDVLLCDADVRSVLVLSHVYNLPVIQLSVSGVSLSKYDITGEPNRNYLSSFNKKHEDFTIWEAVINFWSNLKDSVLLKAIDETENEIVQEKFGSDVPDIRDLYDNVKLLIMNIHPVWAGNYRVPQNVLLLGGLHLKAEKPLPNTLETYLDSAVNGVILVSFGDVIKWFNLPVEKSKILIKVLSELPFQVLMKSDTEKQIDNAPNIYVRKWIPQSDVLRHPNIKLFITHAGTLSTFESIDTGVPMIGIPQKSDQQYNANKFEEYGIGLKLDFDTLTEKTFRSAIDYILRNESFYHNTARLGAVMRDQPQSPLSRAVWWTEYVLRHDDCRYLHSPVACSTPTTFETGLLVALILFCFFVTFLVMSAYYVYKYVMRRKEEIKVKLY